MLQLERLFRIEAGSAKGLVCRLAAGCGQIGTFRCKPDLSLSFIPCVNTTYQQALVLQPTQQRGHGRLAQPDFSRQITHRHIVFFPEGHHDHELRVSQAKGFKQRSVSPR